MSNLAPEPIVTSSPSVDAGLSPAPDAPPHRAAAGGAMRGLGAMGPRAGDSESSPRLDALRSSAGEARQSGRRFDLMRYLRLRRAR